MNWDGPGLEAWRAWRPEDVARRFDGIGVPWCVVGGWAIDLFLGGETRAHADLEIAILRGDFPAVRVRLQDCVLHVVGDGEVRRLPEGALPPEDKHQNWVLDPSANLWRLDVMLEPGDVHNWVFRRDVRVTAPRDGLMRARYGVPYLAPEGVLLFKAKRAAAKDQADFEACLPHLDAAARTWLRHALERVHPGHAWIARLAAPRGPDG
jgi:hypothetical protein